MTKESYKTVKAALKRFKHRHWTAELKKISLEVAKVYHRENPGAYDRGRIENWPAAIITSVVRNIWTTDDRMISKIPIDEICDFYQVNKNTISQKATKIDQILGIDFLSEEFKTEEHHTVIQKLLLHGDEEPEEVHPLALDEDWSGSMLNNRMIVEVWIKSGRRFSRSRMLQTERLIEKESRKLAEIYGPVEILGFNHNAGNNKMTCTVDLRGDALLNLHVILKERGLHIDALIPVDQSSFEDSHQENRFWPDGHYFQFIETYLSGPDLRKYDTIEEMNEMMEKMKGKTPEQLQKENPPDDASQAWLISLKAYRLPEEVSRRILEQALKLDPDCLEAHLCRIGWMEDAEKRIDALEDLLDHGDRVLGVNNPDFDPEMWWGDFHTRPHMRAMNLLGVDLLESGYIDEGLEILMQILQMNHTDNMGVRYTLIEAATLHRKPDIFYKMLELYPDEMGLSFYYCKALVAYFKYGNKAKSKKIAVKAFERNPFPILLIAGAEEFPEETGYFKIGSKEEAAEIVPFLSHIADKHKKAIDWLIQVFVKGRYIDRRKDDGDEARVVDMYGDRD
jgi:tetratricopeptide (TPR) repeat protein